MLKRAVASAVMVTALLFSGGGGVALAENEQVCTGEKYDVEQLPATTADGVVISLVDENTVLFDLPDNAVSATVCVKAGSANQEDGGPVYVVIDGDAEIDHPTGKDLSHVSVVDVVFEETPSPTPSPSPSPSPSESPSPTPPGKPDKPEKPEDKGPTVQHGPLPVTGFDAVDAGLLAGALLLIGGSILWAIKREKSDI